MLDVNPYTVLNVRREFTLDELKTKYKKLAKIHHPDKGGDQDIFDMITDCFKKLLSEYKIRLSDKTFKEMKDNFKGELNTTRSYIANEESIRKFNKTYDQTRLPNPYLDNGYSEFMNEKEVKTTNMNYVVEKYQDPIGIQPNLEYYELGVHSVNDYSAPNKMNTNLQFSDYKLAHTTSKLIDIDDVKTRGDYRNIDDIKLKRKEQSFDMTNKDKKYYETILQKANDYENNRVNSMKDYDNSWEKQAKYINKLLISN